MRVQRLIIGLGNPGVEYEGTRHNIGFAVVDALAEQARASFEHGSGNALVAWASLRGRGVGLVKPQTYMNLSGAAARALMGKCGLQPPDLLIVVDDINLPVGALRLRQGGSAGGHNGIQDIMDRLGRDDFARLRIGVGGNFSRGRQADYVLSPFSEEERPVMEQAVKDAAQAAVTFVTDGLMTAMNRFNKRGRTEERKEG